MKRFDIRHLLHRGHFTAHCMYLGAVSYEAHGMYGTAAFVLLAFVVLGAVLGVQE